MAIIKSKIKIDSPLYIENHQSMTALVKSLHSNIKSIEQGGGAKSIERQKAKGKLPVRERINTLLDEDSDFLEIGLFAAWQVYDEPIPCAGIVAGIGKVKGIDCMVIANDPSVKGELTTLLRSKSIYAPKKSQSDATFPVFTWWILVEPTFLTSQMYFQTKSISGVFSLIRRKCLPRGSHK